MSNKSSLTPTPGRKIAAILAADVVEYSRLMGMDEAGTLAALKIRRALFEQLVKEFGGEEFGSVGDSLMAQFPSAVNAVRCAQAIQHAIAKENEPLPPERRMLLRIGVNLGDVIEESGALFGDGVNVAARLQSLAAPGGILISGAIYEQVRKKLPVRFNDMGMRHVKNIPDPVSTYEVLDTDERHSLLKGLARYSRRWRRSGQRAVCRRPFRGSDQCPGRNSGSESGGPDVFILFQGQGRETGCDRGDARG